MTPNVVWIWVLRFLLMADRDISPRSSALIIRPRGELTGPGSSAYEQDGNTTSYASENDNGGVFEQTTLS